jgi:hypothetical protein
MLKPTERQRILDFLTKHASDDILIAAMNRVVSNIEDTKVLMEWCNTYKPSVVPTSDLLKKDEPEREPARETPVLDNPEDLGPVPKKLGANGQAIEKLMAKETSEWSVDGLKHRLKLPESKIKPMLALLLERGKIKRVGNFTYQIV